MIMEKASIQVIDFLQNGPSNPGKVKAVVSPLYLEVNPNNWCQGDVWQCLSMLTWSTGNCLCACVYLKKTKSLWLWIAVVAFWRGAKNALPVANASLPFCHDKWSNSNAIDTNKVIFCFATDVIALLKLERRFDLRRETLNAEHQTRISECYRHSLNGSVSTVDDATQKQTRHRQFLHDEHPE